MDILNDVVLYSTHCPMCILLENKLNQKNIKYTKNDDVEEMKRLGFTSVPVLKVGEKFMNAPDAMNYVNNI